MNHKLFSLFAIVALVSCTSAWAGTYKEIFVCNYMPGGGFPSGGVVADKDGNLYGADQAGGGLNYDDGTIFELSRLSNGTWTETVLYTFTGLNDGDNPGADVTRDPVTGTLYGTTEYVDGDRYDIPIGSPDFHRRYMDL